MKNVVIINAHQPYAFSEGRLNASLVDHAEAFFAKKGCSVKKIKMGEDFNADDQIRNHIWADLIVLQSPVNWMGVPWSFKKYMDEVYSYGMDGRLCNGDGRTREDPNMQYGQGGTLRDKKYMLSLTFNAPKESFDDQHSFCFRENRSTICFSRCI